MEQAFSPQLCEISDSMGLGLYQRLSTQEASLFLRCPLKTIEQLIAQNKIGYISLPNADIEFFGYMLLEYMLEHVNEPVKQAKQSQNTHQERILRLEEVTQMVGLSRTTLWRMERKGEFPSRIPLSSRSVGWRSVDIENWMKNK
ncbi:AlpA family transcriptional regulator [Pseudoalteromonas sp. XMcav11-Q]|uniref:helix-turn-helix transcriptional regulator n=1 Tax=Pseudoalteromonas sp. XMcav11-Q TaxID=3136665 RepID=UPI0032C3FB58